ncbi:MAG: acyl-CoA thioesterase [Novipirellula sp. JB048]
MKTHTVELRVRYDECDPMGFVHHSNYLRYFEIGRTELLRAAGGCYRDMETAGQLVVVVRVDCRYRRPARYDDLITVQTSIARVTAAKIIHEYAITRENPAGQAESLVDATVTLAVIDREGNLQRVPPTLLEQYERGE